MAIDPATCQSLLTAQLTKKVADDPVTRQLTVFARLRTLLSVKIQDSFFSLVRSQ